MIKKFFAAVICVLLVCAAAVPAFAGQNDDAFKGASLELLVDLDGGDEENGFQMRGFTASPDGKYVYGGFLQSYRHVSKIDTATGEHVAQYVPEIENDDYDGVVANNNYPKGLAVDCRGYLFVGITHDVPNTSYISIACVDTTPDEEGFMTEISYITEDLDTTRVGINGVASVKIGDRILLYVVTCYNKDTIRCYDVTDVTDMKLYDGFGVNGVVDYNELTGSQSDPGYIAVDVDGYLYLCYKADGSSYSKGSHVIKIETDGKSIVSQVEIPQAYGICTAGDYLFVTTYDDDNSKVVVLNKSDLSQVAELVYEDQIYSLSGCGYGGGYLYVGDHGSGSSAIPGTVLRSTPLNITQDPRELETAEVDPSVVPQVTTEPEDTQQPDGPADRIVICDFTDPAMVAKVGTGNNCTFEYDEAKGCLKITTTGSDPYFTLPMKKEQRFDGDKYNLLCLTYMTDVEDVTGEVFFTAKGSSDLASNHIKYYMDPASEFTDLEIDMFDDDKGNWTGEIRSLRLDPSTSDEEDQVFYLKTVYVKEGEKIEETTAVVTDAPATEADTKADTAATDAPDTTNAPNTTKKVDDKSGKSNTGLIIGIIAGVVVVAAGVAAGVILSKKKKK
ncbi:MAG: hypothetical protein J6330_10740 [Clostridia bacterium]|nr:hypothetical protein [Clostridia bacterium]